MEEDERCPRCGSAEWQFPTDGPALLEAVVDVCPGCEQIERLENRTRSDKDHPVVPGSRTVLAPHVGGDE